MSTAVAGLVARFAAGCHVSTHRMTTPMPKDGIACFFAHNVAGITSAPVHHACRVSLIAAKSAS